jgi:hypothetical protein
MSCEENLLFIIDIERPKESSEDRAGPLQILII